MKKTKQKTINNTISLQEANEYIANESNEFGVVEESHQYRLGDFLEGFHQMRKGCKMVYEFNSENLNCIIPEQQREYLKGNDLVWCQELVETIFKNSSLDEVELHPTSNGYELHDGQQRLVTLGRFYKGEFPRLVKTKNGTRNVYFDELTEENKQTFLNFNVFVRIVKGTPKAVAMAFACRNKPNTPMTRAEAYISLNSEQPLVKNLKKIFGPDSSNELLPVPGISGEYYNDKNSRYYIPRFYPQNKDGYKKDGDIKRYNIILYVLRLVATLRYEGKFLQSNVNKKQYLVKHGESFDENYTDTLVLRYLEENADNPASIYECIGIVNDFLVKATSLTHNRILINDLIKKGLTIKRDSQLTKSQPWPRLYAQYMCNNDDLVDENLTYNKASYIYTLRSDVDSFSNSKGWIEFVLREMKPYEHHLFCVVKDVTYLRPTYTALCGGYDFLTLKPIPTGAGHIECWRMHKFDKPMVGGRNDVTNLSVLSVESHEIINKSNSYSTDWQKRRWFDLCEVVKKYMDKFHNVPKQEYVIREMAKKGHFPEELNIENFK